MSTSYVPSIRFNLNPSRAQSTGSRRISGNLTHFAYIFLIRCLRTSITSSSLKQISALPLHLHCVTKTAALVMIETWSDAHQV